MTNETSVWPEYSRFTTGDLATLSRFIASPANLRSFVAVVGLLLVYVVGVFLPLPGRGAISAASTEPWWFLTLIDFLLTGGAFGRGAIFAIGITASMLIGSPRKTQQHFIRLLLGYCRVGIGAVVVAAAFRWRGVVAPDIRTFVVDAALLGLGGVAVHLIDRRLAVYRGPSLLCVNVCLTLFDGLRALMTPSAVAGGYAATAPLWATIAFIIVSANFLHRSRVHVDVENVRDPDHRRATVQVSPIDEPLLDSIGAISLILYVPVAGLVSLLFGWRSVTPSNSAVFLVLSLTAFGLMWLAFRQVSRFAGLAALLGEKSLFAACNPRSLAERMFDNFWVVRDLRPGPETEQVIRSKMDRVVTRAFLLFGLWFLIAFVTERYIRSSGRVSPFPYGPVVFVLMLLMVVGYVSMLTRHIGATLNHFKQLLRGQSRVLEDTYPLRMPHTAAQLSIDADVQRYWEQEQLSDQWREVVDWLKLARDIQPLRRRTSSDRPTITTRVIRLGAGVVVAVVVSFVAGAVCVAFYPDLTRRDLALIILPTIVTTIAAPEAILGLLRKFSARS